MRPDRPDRGGSVSVVAMDRREPRVDQVSARALAIGLGAAVCGAILVVLTRDLGPGAGVAIFMLAVTIAAVSGGIWAGIVTALLSSVMLPWIEQPAQGFQFEQLRDVIASVVFLAIAAVVGLVVGNAAAERRRATEREREARLVALLLDPFNLAMCSVEVVLDGHEMSAVARRDDVELGGPTEILPVVIASV